MHPRMTTIFNERKCSAGHIFMEQNAPQARLMKHNAPQAGFFD